jgi:hypothetical protein
VPGLVQRAPGCPYKTTVILEAATACSLGDVSAYAVRSASNLPSDGQLGKMIPTNYNSPNFVSQLFCQLIHVKILEIRSRHVHFTRKQLTTDN